MCPGVAGTDPNNAYDCPGYLGAFVLLGQRAPAINQAVANFLPTTASIAVGVPAAEGAGITTLGLRAGAPKGISVLGHWPEYIKLADELNAPRFDIGELWGKLSPAVRRALNHDFLDAVAERGDDVILSVHRNAVKIPSELEDEIKYLLEKGYSWAKSGKRLLAPK